MSLISSIRNRNVLDKFSRIIHTSVAKDFIKPEEDEFRVLDLRSKKVKVQERLNAYIKPPIPPPREKRMSTDQDWPSVWPGPRTFHPASVPLPLRQGWVGKKIVPPSKYANAELMKLPNFLHLTPPAVRRHCEALKKFCTPWPEGLKTDEDCELHFPLDVTTTDYCHSSPRIRDPKARVVTFKVRATRFAFNKHAKDKFCRLLGERYNDETGIVTIVSDRCPLRTQNYNYNHYLLLALFHESWNVEAWEDEKSESDMEYYDWERNRSKARYIAFKLWPSQSSDIDVQSISLLNDHIAHQYKQAVSDYINKVEDHASLQKYKEATLKFLLPNPAVQTKD